VRRRATPTWSVPALAKQAAPIGAALLAMGSLAMAWSAAYASKAPPAAHAAHALNATDTAYLEYIQSRSSGSQVYEVGKAYGTIPGKMRVHLNTENYSGSFTIETHAGNINGHGSATPNEQEGSNYVSFRGSLVVKGGTGRYAHAHGTAKLYGTFEHKKTYALVIQTTGRLSY
jgi:hypothetical protein